MIQRVYIVIEVGLSEDELMHYTIGSGPEDIARLWKSERAISAALKRMCKRMQAGETFVPVDFYTR